MPWPEFLVLAQNRTRDMMFQNPGGNLWWFRETFSFSESEVESVLLELDFNRRSEC